MTEATKEQTRSATATWLVDEEEQRACAYLPGAFVEIKRVPGPRQAKGWEYIASFTTGYYEAPYRTALIVAPDLLDAIEELQPRASDVYLFKA